MTETRFPTGISGKKNDDLDISSDSDIALYPQGNIWISQGTKLIFEGTTPDDWEVKLQATTVTADRDIILPDADGTVAVSVSDTTTTTQGQLNLDFTLSSTGNISATGSAFGIASNSSPTFAGLTINGSSIVFEGSSEDANETTLTVTNPTADNTITLPNASGTVALTTDILVYSISAETATGGVNLRLTGSDSSTDNVKLTAGSNVTLTRTSADEITIASSGGGGGTTYSISAETATGGVNLRLTGSDSSTDNVKLTAGSNVTLTRTSADEITIASSGGGGGLSSRTTVSVTTASIADAATDNVSITSAAKSYAVLSIQVDAASWVRVYSSSTARTNDSSRTELVDPDPDAGVHAEIITVGATTVKFTPASIGWNDESPVTDTIYLAIKNKSGTTRTITADLVILPLEA